MMKRVSLFFCFLFVCISSVFPEVTVSVVTGFESDLSEEKTLFTRIYSLLYKDLTTTLSIDNPTTHFDQLFDDEVALIQDQEEPVYGVRARHNGKMAAFASFTPTGTAGELFLRWGIMMPASTAIRVEVAQALEGFATQAFSTMDTLFAMAPTACTVQKYLLQRYNFVECDRTFDGYDPEIYTCLKYTKT